MRGLKRSRARADADRFWTSRAVCPANEGIETTSPSSSTLPEYQAARSAPLMRGLKRGIQRDSSNPLAYRRAVCPANEGIETKDGDFVMRRMLKLAARSAPLMRGLKRERGHPIKMFVTQSRAVCPANEGIETIPTCGTRGRRNPCRAVCPANEGIETSRERIWF